MTTFVVIESITPNQSLVFSAQQGPQGATGSTGAKGDTGTTGATGATGNPGTAATVAVGTTTTGAAGSSATVANSGTTSAAVFDFTIPRGNTGDTGSAATVAVGSTTTGAAGTSASVTNSGTSSAATFNFTIPQGQPGTPGATSTATPLALGTAAAGTGTLGSKDDHVHPTTGVGLTANPLSQFAATTSAQLAGVVSDETGSGALVFANTPTINGPTITATGQTPVIHGMLIPSTHSIFFEGTTDDAFETTFGVVDPTADRTINLPNTSGTIITTGNLSEALPSQTGNSGKYLTTDGTASSWGTVSSYSAPTIGSTSITSGGTFTTLPGVTSINGATVPSSGTLATTAQLYSAPTLGSTSIASGATVTTIAGLTLTSPVINTPKISCDYFAKTAAYTFASGDEGDIFSMNNAATQQFNIPTDATFNFAIGTEFTVFWLTGAGQPTIGAVTPGTTTVISTGATSATPKLRVANSGATCKKIAANSWIIFGDLA
jgi:hypothetical protein